MRLCFQFTASFFIMQPKYLAQRDLNLLWHPNKNRLCTNCTADFYCVHQCFIFPTTLAEFILTELFWNVCNKPLQDRRHLSAACIALRIQCIVAHSGDQSKIHTPGHSLGGVSRNSLVIAEILHSHSILNSIHTPIPGVAVEHGCKLFPGD